MKKLIIIEEESNKDTLVKNKLLNFIISLVCYAIVLILVSLMFKSFYINNKYFGLYAIIVIVLYILNKTIKPVLVVMTLPITALTMGLSYPIVNMIILNITSFIMGNNFNISGFFTCFFASILISIFNIFMDGLIIKPMTRKDN